jgi:hypothetical protein
MSTHEEEASEEEVRKLAETKATIEKRIRRLEDEIKNLRSVLDVVNSTLAEKSFRRAEIASKPEVLQTPPSTKEVTVLPPKVQYKQVVPLKTATGTLLAQMQIGDDVVRVTPAEGVPLNVTTPPFQAFLVSRILEPMQAKDKEAVRTGEVSPEKAFSFNVVQDGDIVREIVISNYRDPKRLQEIKTSLRWTFEKMYEKTVRKG